jgi:hypothetical protein
MRTGTEGESIQERPVITISMPVVSLNSSKSKVKINSRERQCLGPRDPIGQFVTGTSGPPSKRSKPCKAPPSHKAYEVLTAFASTNYQGQS